MLEHLERQKSLTANQWKIFTAATVGDMLDFFDFYLIGFVLAFIVGGWHLTMGSRGRSFFLPASAHRSDRCSGAGWPTR